MNPSTQTRQRSGADPDSLALGAADQHYSFGLRGRLLLLVIFIVVLAGSAMAVFSTALNSVEEALNKIVGEDVPRLNIAVQLSSQVQTVVVLIPVLSSSASDAARGEALHRIYQELDNIRATLKILSTHVGEAKRLAELEQYLSDIRNNTFSLDSMVIRRFNLESSLATSMERLAEVRKRLRNLNRSQNNVARWQLEAYDALGVAAEATLLTRQEDLLKIIEDIETRTHRVQAMSADRRNLSAELGSIRQALAEVVSGPSSPARLRLELLQLNYWRDTRLSINAHLSDRFLLAANQFGSETQAGVVSTAQRLREQLKRHEAVSFMAFAAILGGMLIMIAYVSHFVVRRLLLIRNNIRSFLNHDQPPPIPSFGADEVGDIARALNFYVQLIAERELALGAAKNDAEHALHDLRRTQAELVQAEKLASLGGLVAGVAHELNTPIGNALVAATALEEFANRFQAAFDRGDLRKSSLKDFAETSIEMAELISRSCHRAADLIASFKQIAVDQTSENRRVFNLLQLVQDIVRSMQPTFKNESWEIEIEVEGDISCDSYPGPLGQVMSNIIQNAANHAFKGRDSGTLRIQARAVADRVEMHFVDDGKGMDNATLGRIFEPFFTTRLGQGGSGLGLSISLNIVTGMLGGSLKASSEPQRGTIFILSFPMIVRPMELAVPLAA